MSDNVAGRDWHTDYDCKDPALGGHFFEIARDLHATCPVARSQVGTGYWVATKYEDVHRIMRDWESFTNLDGFIPNQPPDMPTLYPTSLDPPRHTALRGALNPLLAPPVLRAKEQEIRAVMNGLIDRLATGREIDLVTEVANLYPALVFCHVLCNMPYDLSIELERDFHLAVYGALDEVGPAFVRSATKLSAFMRERQRQGPRGDLVDGVLSLDVPELDLSWEDKVGIMNSFALGGIGTTAYTFARSVEYLGRHPDIRQRITDEPGLLPRALEEFIRVHGGGAHGHRGCRRDTVLSDGTNVKAGDSVVIGFAAAQLDPDLAPNSYEVDIDRFPNRHGAFGTGPHRCIGSHLARYALRLGLETWLARVPQYDIDPAFEPQVEISFVRAVKSMPLTPRRVLPVAA